MPYRRGSLLTQAGGGGGKGRASWSGLLALVGACVLAVVVAFAGAARGAASRSHAGPSGLVAFLLPDNVTPRWENNDRPAFVAAMKRYAPRVRVEVLNALNDPAKQQAQAEAALAEGAKVLVVIPIDSKGAAVIANEAARQNVPVIAYDRLIDNAKIAYYVADDGLRIGKLQGEYIAAHTKLGSRVAVINGSPDDNNAHRHYAGYMSVLQPLFKSGARKEVANVWTPGWDPSKAQQEMEQILTQTNNGVDAVLSANDGMAGGIIAALQAQGLAGKVPVTGLDGTLAGLQLILRGKQSMTVWRSFHKFGNTTARLTVSLLEHKKPPASLFRHSQTVFNGEVKVRWAPIEPIVITAANMGLEIKDGTVTRAQLCAGMPKVGPCK